VYISFVGDITIFHAIKSPNDNNLLQSVSIPDEVVTTLPGRLSTLLKLQLIHHQEKRTFGCLHMNVMNRMEVLGLGGSVH